MTDKERANIVLKRIGEMPYFDPEAIVKVLVNEFELVRKDSEAELQRLQQTQKELLKLVGQTSLALKMFKHTIVEQDMIVPQWVNNFIDAHEAALAGDA